MPFIDLSKQEEKEPVPGYRVVFVHSERMTLAYWTVAEGAVMPKHAHPHEQVASVIDGRFELTVAGETKVLEPGAVAVIPPDTPHAGKALTLCRLIDAFQPVREDFRG
ncbi:MAG: cupin domain-containing protein [Planctomycetota bacterium]|jgi:quercetin dioxygenase-like cupin family protein